MKALVIFDSFFGNTEKIARSVGMALGEQAAVARVGEVKAEQLAGLDLLVVGSPTRAFRPSPATQAFLKSIGKGSLQGVKVAAFDTRIRPEDTNSGFLRFMVRIFGYAAQPIADQLKNKGGSLVLPPEGFYVKDTEGPLKDGELARSAAWGKKILA